MPKTIPAKPSKAHTTLAQMGDIVDWLEEEKNFQLVSGSALQGQSVIAGQKLKKMDGFRALAEYMNAKHNLNWSGETAKRRFDSSKKVQGNAFSWRIVYSTCNL